MLKFTTCLYGFTNYIIVQLITLMHGYLGTLS